MPDPPTPEPPDYAPRKSRVPSPSIQFKPIPTESRGLRWVQIICFLVLAAFVFFAAYMMWFVKTLEPVAP